LKNFNPESGDEQELGLVLIVNIEEGHSPIDVDGIIASKNISNRSTIELLRNIVLSKNNEQEYKRQANILTSPSGNNEAV
jgi:hypothetical protein